MRRRTGDVVARQYDLPAIRADEPGNQVEQRPRRPIVLFSPVPAANTSQTDSGYVKELCDALTVGATYANWQMSLEKTFATCVMNASPASQICTPAFPAPPKP